MQILRLKRGKIPKMRTAPSSNQGCSGKLARSQIYAREISFATTNGRSNASTFYRNQLARQND